jgi:hypothetical protein
MQVGGTASTSANSTRPVVPITSPSSESPDTAVEPIASASAVKPWKTLLRIEMFRVAPRTTILREADSPVTERAP